MNTSLDRSKAPEAAPLHNIHLPDFQTVYLSNGTPVYLLPFGAVEVVELQVIFRAGKAYESAVGISAYTSRMMQEGTQNYSSLQIAQELDGQGAWLSAEVGEESLAFKMATTTDKLVEVLPYLIDILNHPLFPEREFFRMKGQALDRLKVSEQKARTKAQRKFSALMYGTDHPYGQTLGAKELESIQLDMLKAYYKELLVPGNIEIAISGRYDEGHVMKMLEHSFGKSDRSSFVLPPSQTAAKASTSPGGRYHVSHEGPQSTIRLGHRGVSRSHPDYYRIDVVNTILGGYFGSRLMKNIREEKGYTYGIYSAYWPSRHHGEMFIQADVGNEYVELTIDEIKKEITHLQQDGVDESEMELVKNYLLGRSINRRETLFQLGDLLRFSIMHDVSFAELDRRYEVLNEMKIEDVPAIATQYFRLEDMIEVVAGAKG
ncbi:MAG: pitrilysin family protein [Bacteroidota bacterium]